MTLKSPFEINWRLDGKLRLSEAQLGLISSKQMCQEQIGLDLKPEAMHNFFFVCSLNIIDPLALFSTLRVGIMWQKLGLPILPWILSSNANPKVSDSGAAMKFEFCMLKYTTQADF